MVFARKIVEERAFADVGGFGDVFDGGFSETFLGEEAKRRTEKTFADVGTAALAARRRWL